MYQRLIKHETLPAHLLDRVGKYAWDWEPRTGVSGTVMLPTLIH